MKIIKYFLSFISLFSLFSCNNDKLNEEEISKAKIILPWLNEKHTYLDYSLSEDKLEINIPLEFSEKVELDNISKVVLLSASNESETTLNELSLIEGNFFNLNLSYDEAKNYNKLIITLDNNNSYEIPINLSYLKSTSNPSDSNVTLKYINGDSIKKNYGYEFKLTYLLSTQNSITLEGLDESLKYSIYDDASFTLLALEDGSFKKRDSLANINLDEGTYLLEISIPEDGLIYYFNNFIGINFSDRNSLKYYLYPDNYELLSLTDLYLDIYKTLS